MAAPLLCFESALHHKHSSWTEFIFSHPIIFLTIPSIQVWTNSHFFDTIFTI